MTEQPESKTNKVQEKKRPSVSSASVAAQSEDIVYGGCEGPNAMYVKLVSSEGHEFIVKRKHVLISETIAAMIQGPGDFAENETNVIELPDIPARVLEKVCMFFEYKEHHIGRFLEIPEFPVEPEIAVELLYAADFLGC